MPGYIVRSGYYNFGELGRIKVNVRSTARSVKARWKGGEIVVSAPLNISYDDLLDILREFKPRLDTKKPESMYHPGQNFDFGEFSVEISVQKHMPDKMFVQKNNNNCCIAVGSNWNFDDTQTTKAISRFMCRIAEVYSQVLIDTGKEVAARVGKAPLMWKISSGHRILGHCDSHGIIALSCALMFYPPHLREYVICHELAHLSEMSHSERFHMICNLYCSGREKQLEKEIKNFVPPIVR